MNYKDAVERVHAAYPHGHPEYIVAAIRAAGRAEMEPELTRARAAIEEARREERGKIMAEIRAIYVPCPPDQPNAQQLDGGTVTPIYGCDTLQWIMDALGTTPTGDENGIR